MFVWWCLAPLSTIFQIYRGDQCLSPLMLWVRISIRARCTTLCDKVCQWLARGRWFSPCPPGSSTNKTDRHDISEILLKVALNTIKQTLHHLYIQKYMCSVKSTSPWSRFELTTSVVISIDCISSCWSNYHMITTAPKCLQLYHGGNTLNSR
jgi:hypothetical protein